MNQPRLCKVLFFALIFVYNCSPYERRVSLSNENEERIVLFNVKELGRKEIGQVINQISRCEPKVIGLDVLFAESDDKFIDSLLSLEIKNSRNVILLESLENGELVRSVQMFRENILGEGIVEYGVDKNNVITDFVALYEDKNGQEFSFPFLCALYYDAKVKDSFYHTIIPNNLCEIHYTKAQNQFLQFDFDGLSNLSCEKIQGKIVLFGYLGPENKSSFMTPLDKVSGDETKTYSTVIVANIILSILDYKPNEAE